MFRIQAYCRIGFIGTCLLFLFPRLSGAYTVIQASTFAPAGLEQQFIASTTNQYLANLYVNPLFAGTYQIQLIGPNPAYNPPSLPPTTLQDALSLGATVYAYGWVNGQAYERYDNMRILDGHGISCSTDTLCASVVTAAINDIYTKNYSTPTAVPYP